MSNPNCSRTDLAPERQLQHIKNLQSQVNSLYELFSGRPAIEAKAKPSQEKGAKILRIVRDK